MPVTVAPVQPPSAPPTETSEMRGASRRRRRARWAFGAALILLLIGGAIAVVRPRLWPARTANTIVASGRIEGREVTIAPKDIQGRVKNLLVDEGQPVTPGQLLAELDAAQLDARDRTIAANLGALDAQIAQAALDANYAAKQAAANVSAAEALVSGAEARLVRAIAVLANAKADSERAAKLHDERVISLREREQSEMAARTGEADRAAADKEVSHARANLTVAQAAVDAVAVKREQVAVLRHNRDALVAQRAELAASLAERRIVAPSAGTILSRPVEVGDVVSPGSAVFVMVDLNRLYVKVYVAEPDIPKLRLGDRADVSVDAFPGRRFAARISRISQQAEFTPKSVETTEERLKLVFGVELTFVNPDSLLKPGMPADCVIHWQASPPSGDEP